MKRKPIFGVLFVVLFSVTVFAEEPPEESVPITESRAQELAQEVLDGHPVRVRVYDNWQVDSHVYRIVSVPLTGLSLRHDAIKKVFPGINEWTVIVIVGQDQVDEAIAAVVDDFVYVDTYNPGESLFIWPLWSRIPNYEYWLFTDALGEPIQKTSVEIVLHSYFDESQEIYLGKAVLDGKGRLKPLILANSVYRFAFLVSHPQYGKAMVEKYYPEPQSVGDVLRLELPLVPKASQAAMRAIQGTVVDHEGYVLEGMLVTCIGLRGADGQSINVHEGSYGRAVTDERGWFTMYVPLEEEGELSQSLIPAGARYSLSIVPPKRLDIKEHDERDVPAGGRISITMIPMRSDKQFHTFTFEDRGDVITDSQELANIKITVIRSQAQWEELTYDQWKGGCYLQPCTMRATMIRWGRIFTFDQIEVGPESPKELVFRLGDEIIYEGTVVKDKTGEPMPDVLVLVKRFRPKEDLSFTDEELESLRERAWNHVDDPRGKMLYEDDDRVTLTDANGCFQFVFRTGIGNGLGHFMALEKGYATYQIVMGVGETNRDGIVELPPIRLIPEGMKYWPVFVFHDPYGAAITDPSILEQIFFIVEHGFRPNAGRSEHSYGSLMARDEHICGTYYATLVWEDKLLIYEPVKIDWGGPPEVIFKVKEIKLAGVLYKGRVIHGITGAPVPQAIAVRLVRQIDKLDVSGIRPEQWISIRSNGLELDPNDQALVPLREAFMFDEVARADASGQFQIVLKRDMRGMPGYLVVVQENYLGTQQDLRYCEPDADGSVKLPVMKLYPAATVALEPNLPFLYSTRHRLRFFFHTLRDDPTVWLRDFWATPSSTKGAGVYLKCDLRPNELQTVYVLAGPEIVLKINPMLPRKAPVTIRNIKLKQGQFLDLGRQDFSPAFEVNVKVVSSTGESVEGAAVNCHDADGFSWGLNSQGRMPVTDENGKTVLYVPPYSKGEFIVTSYDHASGTRLQGSTPYEVAGEEEDAGKQFTIQLSD